MEIRRFVIPSLLSLVAAAFIVGLRPELLADLDLRVYDTFARQTAAPAPSSRIVVVDVDERSLAELGQWPWPRAVVARLVTALAERGTALIALDVLFAEPDRLDRLASPARSPSNDAALGAALTKARVVSGFALTFDNPLDARVDAICPRHPIEPAQRYAGMREPTADLFEGTGAVCDFPVIAEGAAASGAINASPDADGVLRRLPVFVRFGAQTYPSLALAAVQQLDQQPLALERLSDDTLQLVRGSRRLVLDRRGNALLRLRGPQRAYTYLSAADVVAGRVPAAALDDRLVFVGATGLGVRDAVTTMLDARFPGVELHATLADVLLGGAGIARPEFADLYEFGSALVCALLAALAIVGCGGLAGTSLAAVVGVSAWFSSRALYAAGTVVLPVSALAGLAAGVTTTAAYQLAIERRRSSAERSRRQQVQRLVVHALMSLTETRSVETGQHARRTTACSRILLSALAARFAPWQRLTAAQIELISMLAPLHDIGKVGISDAVLNKPGALDEHEVAEIRTHPVLGYDSLIRAEHLSGVRDDEVLATAKEIVYTHHERWDGSGYPRGLRGEEIPLAGRVVALVDVYDALVSDRAYRTAMPHEEAVAFILAGRGTHFDPDVVDAFLECQDEMRRVAGAAAQLAMSPRDLVGTRQEVK